MMISFAVFVCLQPPTRVTLQELAARLRVLPSVVYRWDRSEDSCKKALTAAACSP
jgi:hypothetical protein